MGRHFFKAYSCPTGHCQTELNDAICLECGQVTRACVAGGYLEVNELMTWYSDMVFLRWLQ